MAVDRGGLEYNINIQIDTLEDLDKFRASLKGMAAEAKQLSKANRQRAKDSRDSARETAKEAAAVRKKLTIQQLAARAERNLSRKQAVDRARANAAQAAGFRLDRQAATEAQKKRKAEQDLNRVLSARERSQQILEAAKRRSINLTTEERRKLQLLTQEEKKQIDSVQRLAAAQRRLAAARQQRSNQSLAQLRAEARAQEILNKAAEKQAVARTLQQRGFAPDGSEIQRIGLFERAWGKVNDRLHRTSSNANRLSFTFRRLFGILAAFAAARAGIQLIQDIVKEMIGFNARLEEARLGIASLITATGTVRDQFGGILEGGEALAAAFGLANRQIDLLRADAIRTKATFDELVQTFQIALAPGVGAGLDLDQIRRFTVQISQAATAIGLAGNQLAEEIRSILAGTIQARTTRIATSLGITNEDIRRAKEAGVLFEFLNDRFQAFTRAGQEAEKTFGALFANLRGAFQLVLGAAGEQAFEGLKLVISDVKDLLVETDEITGTLRPNPQVVQAFSEVGSALEQAFQSIRNLLVDFAPSEVIAKIKDVLDAVGTAFQFVVGAIEGVIKGIGTLVNIAKAVAAQIRPLLSLFGVESVSNLREIVALFTQWFLVTKAFSALGLTSIFAQLLIQVGRLGPLIRAVFSGRLITGFVGGLKTAAVAVRNLVSGVGLLGTTGATALGTILPAITAAVAGLEAGGRLGQVLFTDKDLKDTESIFKILTDIYDAKRRIAILDARAARTEAQNEQLFRFSRLKQEINGTGTVLEVFLDSLDATPEVMRRIQEAGEEGFAALSDALETGSIPALVRLRKEFGASEKSLRQLFSGTAVFRDGAENIEDLNRALDAVSREGLPSFSQAIDEIGPSLSATNKAVEESRNKFRELAEETEKSALKIESARRQAFRPITAEFASLEQERSLKILESNRKLEQSREKQTRQLQSIKEQQGALLRLSDSLSEDDQQRLASIQQLANQRNEREKELKTVQSQVNLQRRLIAVETDPNVRNERQQELVALERQAAAWRSNIDNLTRYIDLRGQEFTTTEAAETAQQILQGNITLAAQERATKEEIDLVTKEIERNEKEINKTYDARNQLLIEQFRLQQQTELIGLSDARERQEIENQISQNKISQQQAAVLRAEQELRLLQEQERIRINLRANELASLQSSRAVALVEGDTQQVAIYDELIQKTRQRTEEERRLYETRRDNQKQTIQNSQNLLRTWELQGTASQNFFESIRLGWEGFVQGIRAVEAELKGPFQVAMQATVTAVQGLANIASNALVDAFDPTMNDRWGSIRNQLAALLKSIAKMIIAEFIKMAIVKAALGFGSQPVVAPGGNTGGLIRDRARGYARGGDIEGRSAPPQLRPRGLHPTDTIPIWAAPGEFMMRKSAVDLYGNEFMQAVNQGAFAPDAIAEILGRNRRISRTSIRRRRAGFAEGGQIPNSVSRAAASQNQAAGTMLVNDNQAEKLIGGGYDGYLRQLNKNKQATRAILGG